MSLFCTSSVCSSALPLGGGCPGVFLFAGGSSACAFIGPCVFTPSLRVAVTEVCAVWGTLWSVALLIVSFPECAVVGLVRTVFWLGRALRDKIFCPWFRSRKSVWCELILSFFREADDRLFLHFP